MTKLVNFKAKYGIALAFILLAAVSGWSINHSAQRSADELRAAQVAACIRGNALRTESNRRMQSHIADRNTLAKFLAAAEIARRQSPKPSDKIAANQYAKLRTSLINNVTFKLSPLIDCEKAVPKQ